MMSGVGSSTTPESHRSLHSTALPAGGTAALESPIKSITIPGPIRDDPLGQQSYTLTGKEKLRGGVRGKNSREKRGWGNLPINVLHTILDNAQDHVELDDVLQRIYGGHPQAFQLVTASLQRVWFCQMRMVSKGWRDAVNSHSFWHAYILAVNVMLRDQFLTPTGLRRRFLEIYGLAERSPFHQANDRTWYVCRACRFKNPCVYSSPPIEHPRGLTNTSKFGTAPTCLKHISRYCTGCLVVGIPRNAPPQNAWAFTRVEMDRELLMCSDRDVDEHGKIRPQGLLCTLCRHAALVHQLALVLNECAYGGPVRGLQTSWKNSFRENYAYMDYVVDSVGTAESMARVVVEEQWLTNHTRWDELLIPVSQLQKHERRLKRIFLRTGKFETRREQSVRLEHMKAICGEEDDHSPDVDREEMICLYREWDRDDKAVDMNEEPWDDEDSDHEEDTIEPKFRSVLREGVISDWVNNRISHGFWVAPTDEVQQLVSRSSRLHTPLDILAAKSTHPFPEQKTLALSPRDCLEDRDYFFSLEPVDREGVVVNDPFLPSRRLLHEIETVFARKLRRRIWDVLVDMVSAMSVILDDQEQAERELSRLGVEYILHTMKNPVAWMKGGMLQEAMHQRQTAEMWETPKGREWQASPVIEAVEDENEELLEPDYGITLHVPIPSSFKQTERKEESDTDMRPVQYKPTAKDRTVSHSPDKIAAVVNKPIDLPTPAASPALGKRKYSPARDDEHKHANANLALISNSIHPATKEVPSTKRQAVASAPSECSQARSTVRSSPPSVPVSDDTKSSVSTGPLPIHPMESNGRRPSDVSATPTTDRDVIVLDDDEAEDGDVTDSTDSSSYFAAKESSPLSGSAESTVDPQKVPWVPSEDSELGPMATRYILNAWYDARASLRGCRCGICVRAKKKRASEGLGWSSWAVGGDGAKRFRIG